jgi:hypothetical protein
MQIIRVCAHLDSDTLRLPELKDFVGKDVEILMVIKSPNAVGQPGGPKDLSALAALAGHDLVDPDAYKEIRAASMI